MTFGKAFSTWGLSFLISKTRLLITNLHTLLDCCVRRDSVFENTLKTTKHYINLALVLPFFITVFYPVQTDVFCTYQPSTELVEMPIVSTVKGPLPTGDPCQEARILLIPFPVSFPSQSLSPGASIWFFFFSFLKGVNTGIELIQVLTDRPNVESQTSAMTLNYAFLSSS